MQWRGNGLLYCRIKSDVDAILNCNAETTGVLALYISRAAQVVFILRPLMAPTLICIYKLSQLT
jgi:hypothetical protein